MSSKRHLRRMKCERKVRFASPTAARIRSKEIVRAGGDLLNVYRCEFCHGWHLGHPPANVEQNQAEKNRDRIINRKLNRAAA